MLFYFFRQLLINLLLTGDKFRFKHFILLHTDSCELCLQVLTDTRAVQKEINILSGKLDRQFTVTDELIFRVCTCMLYCVLCCRFEDTDGYTLFSRGCSTYYDVILTGTGEL